MVKNLDDVLKTMVEKQCIRNEREDSFDPDRCLPAGLTILHVAVCCRNESTVELLLKTPAQASVNHQDAFGRTPFHFEAMKTQEAFKALVDIFNTKWEILPGTPQDSTSSYSYSKLTRMLVANGARGDLHDFSGFTALENSLRAFDPSSKAQEMFKASRSHGLSADKWRSLLGASGKVLRITESKFKILEVSDSSRFVAFKEILNDDTERDYGSILHIAERRL